MHGLGIRHSNVSRGGVHHLKRPVTAAIAAWTLAGATSACGGSGGEEAGAPVEVCVAPDSTVVVAYSLAHPAWPLDPHQREASPLAIDASCEVTEFGAAANQAELGLACDDDDSAATPPTPITLTFSALAPQTEIAATIGQRVRLSLRARTVGYHDPGGSWFVVRDEASDDLIIAALADTLPTGANGALGFDLVDDSSLCEHPCGGDCGPDSFTPHRVAVVAPGESEPVAVLDGTRRSFEHQGRRYQLAVGAARQFDCINCAPNYQLTISPEP